MEIKHKKVTKVGDCYIVEVSEEERKKNYATTEEFNKQFVEYLTLAIRKRLMKTYAHSDENKKLLTI